MSRKNETDHGKIIGLRPYQMAVYEDRHTGILVLHWARQIGKSFTLAAWAVDRLLMKPGRLVTVLSNSRENGAEFLQKCNEVCALLDAILKRYGALVELHDYSPDLKLESMRMELRMTMVDDGGVVHVGRIKVLAANPRTARGFSGDLILDEFAFHEDSQAIWEAAEPILASNADFLCRIASTGNGKHNMFYRLTRPASEISNLKFKISNKGREKKLARRMAREEAERRCDMERRVDEARPLTSAVARDAMARQAGPPDGGEGEERGHISGVRRGKVRVSLPRLLQDVGAAGKRVRLWRGPFNEFGFGLSRVTRTEAHGLGVKVFDQRTREEIAPEAARAQALDKRAYDQNYECVFADESLTLLSHELINAAEREGVGEIAEQDWSAGALALLREAQGELFAGFDVGRKIDLSVITVVERVGGMFLVRGILRMRDLRLPEQQLRLGEVCRVARFRRAAIDMTGLGLGLFEFAQREFGAGRIVGINFGTTVPATKAAQAEGRKRETVRVTEAMALEVLQVYEDRRIQQPAEGRLRDDLRKPERVTSAGGRVSIAATRDEAGHADHFWSLALALEAAGTAGGAFACERIERRRGVLM